jgi:hypothetical protein
MDSKYEKTITIKEVDAFLEVIVSNNGNGEVKRDMAGQLWDFIGKQPKNQQDKIVEHILLFAQSKAAGATDKNLFCLAYAFSAYVSDLYAQSKKTDEKLLRIRNGLEAICKSHLDQKSPAVELLNSMQLATGGVGHAQDDQKFKTIFKDFKTSPLEGLEASMEAKKSQDTPNSLPKSLKSDMVLNLKNYSNNFSLILLPSEMRQKKLISQAEKNSKNMSEADFLINFQIAYRVFEKYPSSDERKAILRDLFKEDHSFRPFIDLFTTLWVNAKLSGKSFSSLKEIFDHTNNESLKIFTKDDATLNQAIVDRIMGNLITINMNSEGKLVQTHALLEVLTGLIGVGAIPVGKDGGINFSSTKEIFNALVEKLFINYSANQLGRDGSFIEYLQRIVNEGKTQNANSKNLGVDQAVLAFCLDNIISVANAKSNAATPQKNDSVSTSTMSAKGGDINTTGTKPSVVDTAKSNAATPQKNDSVSTSTMSSKGGDINTTGTKPSVVDTAKSNAATPPKNDSVSTSTMSAKGGDINTTGTKPSSGNPAVVDKIMNKFVKAGIRSKKGDLVENQALFRALMGLVGAGAIPFYKNGNIDFSSADRVFNVLIEKFAIIYPVDPACKNVDFIGNLKSILDQVEIRISNSGESKGVQATLFSCLDRIFKLASVGPYKTLNYDSIPASTMNATGGGTINTTDTKPSVVDTAKSNDAKPPKDDSVTTSTLKGGDIVNTTDKKPNSPYGWVSTASVTTFFSADKDQKSQKGDDKTDTQSADKSGGVPPKPGG